MPDTPTPLIPLGHAKAAAAAMRALCELDRHDLAGNPADVYALVDELLPVLSDLWAVSANLGTQLAAWAELVASHPRRREQAERLRTVGDQFALAVVQDGARMWRRMDDALAVLDRPRYRADRGIPADWEATRD